MSGPSDSELIGDWEPKPAVTGDAAKRLQAKIERLKVLARKRGVVEPTFDCACGNTGLIEINRSGRSTVVKCKKCSGPNEWCRHRKHRRSCEICRPDAVRQSHGGDTF